MSATADRENQSDLKGGEENQSPVPPSDLARRINQLRRSSLDAANRRERLPQPFFWSLFSSQLAEIKEEKRNKRAVLELLGGADT